VVAQVVRAGGREFPAEIIERIRDAVETDAELSRSELSRQVCQWLSWRQPNGRLREVSCRVALRALEQRGVITLPASRAAGDHCRGREVEREHLGLEEPGVALPTELRKLGRIELVVVG